MHLLLRLSAQLVARILVKLKDCPTNLTMACQFLLWDFAQAK